MAAQCDIKTREELEKLIKDNKITVMTSVGCAPCKRSKELLKSKSFNFAERDLSLEGNENFFACLYEKTQSHYVPQIFVNSKYIGGYKDLMYLENTGLLSDLYKV